MKRAMLYILSICFTEIASANVNPAEHFKIVYPDPLHVSAPRLSTTTSANGAIGYKRFLFVAPSAAAKKEQQHSHALVANTAIRITEENFPRKKSKKRHPFVSGKGDAGYNPHVHTKFYRLKLHLEERFFYSVVRKGKEILIPKT